MAKRTILVNGNEITLLEINNDDYISLSDIMRSFNDEFAIYGWLRNKNTIEFLGVWEQLHNDGFNSNEFVRIKNEAGSNAFNMTPKKWTEATGAIGLTSKAGRYGSGVFAHRDIAVNFCYWLSPTFQLYLIKEFQRLKEVETKEKQEALDWNIKRILSKVNYKIHSDAVKHHLMPQKIQNTAFSGLYYASEADVLNISLFGMTAKEWQEANPNLKGNMRDHATVEQLLVLANLESLNAEFIKMGITKEERLSKLNDTAIHQMQLLVDNSSFDKLLQEGEAIKRIE